MSEKLTDRRDVGSSVSVGAGLAIAGAWLAGAAVTIILLLIIFVWAPSGASTSTSGLGWEGAIFLGLVIAAPMIAAYNVTKLILSKD